MINDERIARDILRYLREHPGSGDTVEGVSKWWVLRQRISESVDAVGHALEQLEKEELVYAHKMADGRTIYYAAAQRQLVGNEGATKPPDEDESI